MLIIRNGLRFLERQTGYVRHEGVAVEVFGRAKASQTQPALSNQANAPVYIYFIRKVTRSDMNLIITDVIRQVNLFPFDLIQQFSV